MNEEKFKLGWDFESNPDLTPDEYVEEDFSHGSDPYSDTDGKRLENQLAKEQENQIANELANDDTFFYHSAGEEVLRYLHDWTWNTLNKSGYRMVVVYLWGERYTGKSRTLRQYKTLIYNILKKRINMLQGSNKTVPFELRQEFLHLGRSIVYFELPTGMDSDKRLFYTILTTKFGMKPVKTVYNSRTAFDFVRKLMEICLIHKIRIIMIDEFDRLENYGFAEKILNHFHYLSNGENWENVYSELKSKGLIKEKPPFTRFILCGINSQIPLLDRVNWNDDRITEIKLDLLTEDDTITLLSKVVKYYRQQYGLTDWNLFEYNASGDVIGYDLNEIKLLTEYSESKGGKLLETVKKAGVIALKNHDYTIRESYYDFASLKTSYLPNIETSVIEVDLVKCEDCGNKFKNTGISIHQRYCKVKSNV